MAPPTEPFSPSLPNLVPVQGKGYAPPSRKKKKKGVKSRPEVRALSSLLSHRHSLLRYLFLPRRTRRHTRSGALPENRPQLDLFSPSRCIREPSPPSHPPASRKQLFHMSLTPFRRHVVTTQDRQDGHYRGSGIPRKLHRRRRIWLSNDPAFDEDDWVG